MAITNARIQMRRGLEKDFNPDEMTPGEWALSLDTKYVRMCFAPGECLRMATYEAFEQDMEEILRILAECRDIRTAVELIRDNVTEAELVIEDYVAQAKQYRDEAEQFRNEAFTTTPDGYADLVQNVADNTAKIDIITDKAELNIKNTASGETIHLTDSADSKVVEFGLYGKAEQKQYSGKNELDNTATTQTIEGVTYTVNENKSVTVNGTAGENGSVLILNSNDISLDLESGSYILSGSPSGGSTSTYRLQFYDGSSMITDYGSGTSFDFTNSGQDYNVAITVFPNATVNNLTFYPMIRLASITDSTYEPYVGGMASPSSDYPQDIEVAGASGSVEVKSVGKNLLENTNTNQTKFGVTFTVNDGVITADGTATDNAIFNIELLTPLAKGNYILSGITGGSATTYFMDLYDKEWTNRAILYNGEREINQGVVYVRMVVAKGYTANNVKFYPMIRLASDTDDTYEPYTETTSLISTPDGIAGINGVYDEVVKYADGSGKRIQRIGKAVFDGSDDELWDVITTNTSNAYRMVARVLQEKIKKNPANDNLVNILCSQLIQRVPNSTYRCVEGVSVGMDGALIVYSSDFNTSDVSLWKAHLQARPMTVLYELAEPIITDLTAEEIAEIEKLYTFYPVTNISNDADCDMAVTYLADSKNYIDNQLAIQAQAQEEALLNMLLLMPDSVQASMIENDTNNLLNEAEV